MADTVSNPSRSPLVLTLFGPCEVRVHGRPLPRLRSRKGLWLLALLTLRHGAEVERSWLAGLLWPDSQERQALGQLRSSLADLRVALGPEADRLRSPRPRTLLLDLKGAEVDAVAFDAAIRRGDRASLEEAVALYRGPLLEGGTEEWMFQERQPREQAFLAALETLAAQARERGGFAVAEQHLRRAVVVDPTREGAQRALMEMLAASGNYAAAIQVYRELRDHLHREMNSAPDGATSALFERLRQEARRRAGAPHPTAPATVSPPSERRLDRPVLPQGTVTFLFTDIEGSTRLWEQHPDAMREALARHDALLRAAIEAHSGFVFKTGGDAFCAVFAQAADALRAAADAQHALQAEPWGEIGPLRVRMALHTGAAQVRDGDYFGPPLNRVGRLLNAGHGGQMLLSQVTAELVRDALPEAGILRDLGAHRLKDLPQPEHLYEFRHPALPDDFPPLHALEAFAHNLPRQLTSFIGREQEMAEVNQLLGTTTLLTLTGSGGCGKTRLALQVAAALVAEFADGVWLVELASISEPALVPPSVAAALGVREEPGRALEATLTDFLHAKTLLLVLDNCEHLLSACAQLADRLLRSCRQLRILASSREGLGIAGETIYRLPSLSVPDPRHPTSAGESIAGYAAVRLFMERASAALPSFRITNENASAVAAVCHQLDGIPLAIELAAARVKVLPVETIRERLDDRFRLLTGGSRTALPRQQTLRALIDWSYDLLTEAEQTLLQRLSVFVGGWTLEAAEAVGAEDGIEKWEVLDLLTSLVEKSLALYEVPGREGRYRLLETVRQYARDRLVEAGEAAQARERHRDWFLALAEQAEPELVGAHQGEWLDRLEREHDNLRASLAWSAAQGQSEAGMRLAGALLEFWYQRGYWTEGREYLAGLLALPGAAARTLGRVKALKGLGLLARHQGEGDNERALHEERLAISQEIGYKQGIADAHGALGAAAQGRRDYGVARAHLEECLAISRELGNRRGIAWSLLVLGGIAHDQGEYETAKGLVEESLTIHRELGFKGGVAWSLGGLANLAYDQGAYGAARLLYEESLAISREIGFKIYIAWTLSRLGSLARLREEHGVARAILEEHLMVCRELGRKRSIVRSLSALGDVLQTQGEYEAAEAHYRESLATRRELDDKPGILNQLERLAAVAIATRQPERSARLFGAAKGLREAMRGSMPPAEGTEHDRSVAAVRDALGEATWAAAWAEGQAMTLEGAMAYALEEAALHGANVKD